MTQPLNYCRQFVQYMNTINRQSTDPYVQYGIAFADSLKNAQKILLPTGGLVANQLDLEFRALDRDQNLRLPYPEIVLEYAIDQSVEEVGEQSANLSKCIIYAAEFEVNEKWWVRVCIATYDRKRSQWVPYPDVIFPAKGYLRNVGKTLQIAIQSRPEYDSMITDEEYMPFVFALLQFLNILACSNVGMERLPNKLSKPNAKLKSPLPFDDYWVLHLNTSTKESEGKGGSHRSPREHLRRGCIVRPEGRKPFWRNATVVNAGTLGKITKDYKV